MPRVRVESLADEILALPEPERDALARAVLPALLATPAGIAGLDDALARLSDSELEALVERARDRGRSLTDDTVTAILDEALRAVRGARRP